MDGEPLAQACRVLSAVVDTLGPGDMLETIQFSSQPRRWKREPVAVTPAIKRAALRWLAGRVASGSTEMRDAILEALRPLREEAQRQVILVTDGFIGFEAEVVAAIATRGSRATRVHAVGVGSAVNRSLTSTAARAGCGAEVIVGLGEDVEPAARRIVARTNAPLIVDLEIGGSAFVAHAGLPDLFAGVPALLPLTLRAAGGEITLRGSSAEGSWEQALTVTPAPYDSGRAEVVSLFGRERVEDLEARVAAGDSSVDPEIERTGLNFGISTRLTSWVAVSETASVDPHSAVRRERMPQQLPYGMSVEALGLRSAAPSMLLAPCASPMMSPAFRPTPSISLGAGFRQSPGFDDVLSCSELAEEDREGGDVERTLRAHVVHRSDAKLVIEIEVDETDLAWETPSLCEVEWTDGTTSRLLVDPGPTTGASLLRPGERARLVLCIDAAQRSRTPFDLRLVLSTITLRLIL